VFFPGVLPKAQLLSLLLQHSYLRWLPQYQSQVLLLVA
jgi:hypothetical protein